VTTVAQSYVDREYFLCAKTNKNNFIQLLIFLSVGLWLSTWELKKIGIWNCLEISNHYYLNAH